MTKQKIFILVSFILLWWCFAFAADSTNVATSFEEDDYGITFYVDFIMASDTTDSWYSKAINLSGFDLTSYVPIAYVWGNATASADVNIEFHCGSEEITQTGVDFSGFLQLTANASFDAQGAATVVSDSISTNTNDTEQLRGSKWLVIEADGQAGNPSATEIYVMIYLHKSDGAIQRHRQFDKGGRKMVVDTN